MSTRKMASFSTPVVGVLCLFYLVDVAWTYPVGAGEEACSTLIPQHGGINAQTSPPPYEINVVIAGDRILVTVDATPGNDRGIRGFALQARDAGNNEIIGVFAPSGPGSRYQYYDCTNQLPGSSNFGGITHVNARTQPPELPMSIVWVPPGGFTDAVRFHATIVRSFDTFWANFVSESIRITGTANNPPTIGSCPEPISQQVVAGGVSISWPIPPCTDPDQPDITLSRTCSPPPGSSFQGVGMTPVTCTCQDDQGAADECAFTVTLTVQPNNPPTLSCPNPLPEVSEPGNIGRPVFFNPTCTDPDQQDFTTVTCFPPSGNRFPVGPTPVTCTCTDSRGASDSCSFSVNVLPISAEDDPCLPGWAFIDQRCFLLVTGSNVPNNQVERRAACQRRRGDLAKLDPAFLFQSFPTGFLTTTSEIYIGLMDVGNNVFRWVIDNSEPTANLPWAVNEPNGGFLEDCVVLNPQDANRWRDTSCTRQLPFLCERPAENPACGSGPFTQRIVGGEDSTLGRWPWIGSLGGNQAQSCGATLITAEWAITAAHCFSPDAVDIFFGDITQSPRGSTRQVSDVTWFPHPLYNPATSEFDIALLYLHTPVTFNSFVSPACVYSSQNVNPVNDNNPPELSELEDCYIAGWGALREFDPILPNVLQEAQVALLTPADCGNYGAQFVPRIMLCAGDTGGQVDTCQGDSGGPLICRNTVDGLWNLAGVVSFGIRCASQGFPGVYTRVSTTRGFVDMARRATDNLFKCAVSGTAALNSQVCDTVVDCEDFTDEMAGCDPIGPGQTVPINSPKYNLRTNFITRTWIFFPTLGRRLTVTFTFNNLVSELGTLETRTPETGPRLSVPAVSTFTSAFPVTGAVGQPIVITMDKTSIGTVAGFQASITDGA